MDINSQSVQDTDTNANKPIEVLSAHVTPQQAKSIKDMISVLNQIHVDKQNGVKILPTDDISYFMNVCINFTCASYMQLFSDTNVIKNIPTKEGKKQFIAFRAKYMNFPIDAQLEDIKRLGLSGKKK